MKHLMYLALVLLVGCVVTPTVTVVPQSEVFDPATLGWSKAAGQATVSGSGFLRTVGGDVKSCAGYTVSLVPHSAYSQERMTIIYGNADAGFSRVHPNGQLSRKPPDPHPDYLAYVRESVCDVNGKFEFTDVPSSTWYATTTVAWRTRSVCGWWCGENPNQLVVQGGAVMKRLNVSDGPHNVVLTNN